MGLKSWYHSQDVLVKVAVVGGVFTVLGGVVAAIVTGGFTLLNTEVQAHRQSTGGPASQRVPSRSATPQPNTARPLKFYDLAEDQKVGPVIQPLIVEGVVPAGTRAWVMVKSSGSYYVQGFLAPYFQSSHFWSLSTVSLGGPQGPINTPYVIYIVLANSQASGVIQEDYKKTGDGNTGTSDMPGGAEVNAVRSITVVRTR